MPINDKASVRKQLYRGRGLFLAACMFSSCFGSPQMVYPTKINSLLMTSSFKVIFDKSLFKRNFTIKVII